MKTSEIRQKFITYFEKHNHKKMASSSLVPSNDPTLLFTNAGMVQFKDAFTGKSNPNDKRVVTVQKCVRAGGKHNDLENVGFTARHHTFFEMMGNFSFGDYFKSEAIKMAWDFLTKELGISADKLYVTAHHSDQEAADIWHEQEGVPKDRIFFRGDKDNFWEMGEVGPCGPCSEIFYDHGEKYTDPKADTSKCILDDEERYVEIWNLVFMQFEKYKEDGEIKKRPLPNPCVDTGSGLERVAAVKQGVYNNFDTDLFANMIKNIESISNEKYSKHPKWMRVVADHARSASMLLSDGVIPSNEGRGYVLRRIIRRAVRHLDLLGVSETKFYTLVDDVFESLGQEYKENAKNKDFVIKYLRLEEDSFRKTLASGLKLLEKEIAQLKSEKSNTLSGQKAFHLYDTHGFPLDLTEMILAENHLHVDEAGFNIAMEEQKERSKKAGDFSAHSDNSKDFYEIQEAKGNTSFIGYENLEAQATLIGKVDLGEMTALVFNQTPFYAEGGGQKGDSGIVQDENGNTIGIITDTKKPVDGIFAHYVNEDNGFELGKNYKLVVDAKERRLTMCNHTATHLLQAALIKVLGSHIKQAGSHVGPERLRFDFTHPEAMTKEQISEVEALVNEQVKQQTDVAPKIMAKDEAMKMGAMALFGEKYGSQVRVIDIPGFSVELCGGTHVQNTSDIGYFKILSEASLASGVRRIEAVTNSGAYEYVDEKLATLEKLEALFNSKGDLLLKNAKNLQDNLSGANKEIKSLKDKLQTISAQSMFDGVQNISNDLVFKHIELDSEDDMRKVGDLFIDKFKNGVCLITQAKGDKLGVILKTFKNNKSLNCSNILKESMNKFSGRGGGKPDMAQGSVDLNKKNEFVQDVIGHFY
jgi:alanyl-tRNA synthetase